MFAVLVVVCAAGVRIPESMQYLPFAVSLVVLGLPHGALDHVVLSRVARRLPDARAMASVSLLYLAVGGAVVLLWFLAPGVAFIVFILMTWFHWGQGDLHVEAMRESEAVPSRLTRAGMLTLRGALPMIVPLIAFPQVYLGVFRDTTGVIADPLVDVTPFFESSEVRLLITGALLVLTVLTFIGTARRRWASVAGRRAWWGDLGEVLLLAAFFTTVPPILAVGLYFCLWHSLRHIVRLSLLDPGSRTPANAPGPDRAPGFGPALRPGSTLRFGTALRRFALQSAPITAIALGLLVVLFLVVPQAGLGNGALLGLYLVLISALTLPHVVVVTIMDARQDVWGRKPRVDLVPAR